MIYYNENGQQHRKYVLMSLTLVFCKLSDSLIFLLELSNLICRLFPD